MIKILKTALAAVGLAAMAASAQAALVFNNFNGFNVNSAAAASQPFFTLAASTDITLVDIYTEARLSSDLSASGIVSFLNTSTTTVTTFNVSRSVGPTSFSNGTQFTSLLTFTGSQTLAPGNYTVSVDSSLSTQWAYNATSGGRGFLNVEGVPTPQLQNVPEPMSLALVCLGLAGVVATRRKSA